MSTTTNPTATKERSFATICPGTTTDNPTQWLKLARARYESLTARIEAREASQQVLARWEQDRRILAQEIRQVRAQMPKDRSFGQTKDTDNE